MRGTWDVSQLDYDSAEHCFVETGLNPYDLREKCKDPEGACYVEMKWVAEWMNLPHVKRELGVDNGPVEFVHCNMTTNAGFYAQGQAMHNSAALLPPLVNAGMRLLVFAGDTDGVCNHIVCDLRPILKYLLITCLIGSGALDARA